jgi:GTPase SAR1 family protein
MPIKSYAEMREKKADISRLLVDFAGEIDKLTKLGMAVDGQVLLELKEKLDNDNFKVLVIGEFKNGKSTFINSLMGKKVLPAYATPCTAVINEVVYGESERAMLYFKNPLPDEMSTDIQPRAIQHIKKYEGQGEIPAIELDVDDLVDYVAIPDPSKDQADSIKELPYSKVILEYPIELCKDGIEIIDSPGLNENGTRTKVTEEYLNSADAIVFVFRCPKIAAKSEVDYIVDQIHTRGYKDIFFVCNAINQVPEDERDRLIKCNNKKLESLTDLGTEGIFYVDALGALKAKENHDDEKLNTTGIPEFEASLSEYLRNNKGKSKLLQIIVPCNSFIEKLENENIKAYVSSLDQDMETLKVKVKNAMPNLEIAKGKKESVQLKVEKEMANLKTEISNMMKEQYDEIVRGIPGVVDNMDLENHMTVNPFKQKEKKSALEKEVISKLDQYVQKQMGNWIKTILNPFLESAINKIQDEIGQDIDSFYNKLDDFRYDVSGIEKPKDISGLERVTATIFGTILCGPTYGVIGASLGFGEMVKRSALTYGAVAIAACTPLGIGAIAAAVVGAGIIQIATGGKALTDKYKKQIKEDFISSIKEGKEKSSNDYATNVVKDINEKFDLVVQALNNEIKIEMSKIDSLEEDAKKGEEVRNQKVNELKVISSKIDDIKKSLNEIQIEIQ